MTQRDLPKNGVGFAPGEDIAAAGERGSTRALGIRPRAIQASLLKREAGEGTVRADSISGIIRAISQIAKEPGRGLQLAYLLQHARVRK
jgi:hypothetical protein